MARLDNFLQMAEKAIAGDVGAGIDANLQHRIRCATIQRGHHFGDPCYLQRIEQLPLDGGRKDAGAEWLRENQYVAGASPGIRDDAVGMNHAHDGVAGLGLRIVDRMSSDDVHPSLSRLLCAAQQYPLEHVPRQRPPGEADEAQHGDGPGAHRIDVRQRVGSRDSPEGIRVIHDRRENVDRQRQRDLVRQSIDGRIVARPERDQDVRVDWQRQSAQDLGEIGGTDLGGSAGAV